MPRRTDRRQFLQTSVALGAGFWAAGGVTARASRSPNERIALACVGMEGKGHSDSDDAGQAGDVVAICDVDTDRLGNAGEKRFPKARRYTDFRKMLEEMESSIDAVTVSTPDHTHAPPALMAMRMGKHCFCQKPLTRTVFEARLMGEVARKMNVATQMGNQGTADSDLRRAAAWLRGGGLGAVREVHVWTNRPIWDQGVPRPKSQKHPHNLDWDLWLGPAPQRPYARGYHPFSWRGWWDFGTGALGDMACHEVNMAFMGLDLRAPTVIRAVTSGHNGDSYPAKSIVTYEFPANDWRPEVKLIWYDGGNLPPEDLCEGRDRGDSGKLVIGERGKLWGYQEAFAGAEPVDADHVESPGHFAEWIRAIRGGEPAVSNFPDYAGPLTEVVLAGNLAVWLASVEGEEARIEWDAERMVAKNASGLEELIRPRYRGGYALEG